MEDSDRLAVALMVLAKRYDVDPEAMSAALLVHWADWVVARAVTRSLGGTCDADAACALAAVVSPERIEQAREQLREAGMSDLLGESPL